MESGHADGHCHAIEFLYSNIVEFTFIRQIIPMMGDCWFHSVADQLNRYFEINKNKTKFTGEQVRTTIHQFIEKWQKPEDDMYLE